MLATIYSGLCIRPQISFRSVFRGFCAKENTGSCPTTQRKLALNQHPPTTFKKSQIESNRDQKALNRGILGVRGSRNMWALMTAPDLLALAEPTPRCNPGIRPSTCRWVVVKIVVSSWLLKYNTAPSISGTQKGTIILTTTHIPFVSGSNWKLQDRGGIAKMCKLFALKLHADASTFQKLDYWLGAAEETGSWPFWKRCSPIRSCDFFER